MTKFDTIKAMSESALDAALIAEGIAPDDAIRRAIGAIAEAVAQAAEQRGTSACRLCGRRHPHQHGPDEMLIYRNGLKAGRGLQ